MKKEKSSDQNQSRRKTASRAMTETCEPKLEIFVTDHSPDQWDSGSPEQLLRLYQDIVRDGIESIRYDWHWRNIEPVQGVFDHDQLKRYGNACELMQQAGLKAPTIILSNPPVWATKLCAQDRKVFLECYRNYLEVVVGQLKTCTGEKVSRVQVLNELNNSVYTPFPLHFCIEMVDMTRVVFHSYNPVHIMVTVLASNTGFLVGTPVLKYLQELQKYRHWIDVIGVDYYPGLFHLSPQFLSSRNLSDLYKDMVKNLDLLRSVFDELSLWPNSYELAEVGMRSNAPFAGSERAQRYFYDAFSLAFKHLLVDLQSRGRTLPSRVGFYQAIDETPKDLKGWLLRSWTPYPEHDMGMRTAEGKRKLILLGNKHQHTPVHTTTVSQLQNIVRYLRAPMRKWTVKTG